MFFEPEYPDERGAEPRKRELFDMAPLLKSWYNNKVADG